MFLGILDAVFLVRWEGQVEPASELRTNTRGVVKGGRGGGCRAPDATDATEEVVRGGTGKLEHGRGIMERSDVHYPIVGPLS